MVGLQKHCKTLQRKDGNYYLNYGQFLKKLKSYCINRNIKNVDLVNLPIEGLIDFAHLKKEKGSCKGEPLYYEATESSRIVNNKLDINKIRDSLRRFGSEDVVIESFDSFYKDYIDKHLIEDMINDYLDTIETDNCFKKSEINSIKKNTNNPSLFLSMTYFVKLSFIIFFIFISE